MRAQRHGRIRFWQESNQTHENSVYISLIKLIVFYQHENTEARKD